jgi:two-component system, OmpR family, phosphate regulon response regulator PhoB
VPRVLIVDDERDLASLIEFNLREAGFETHVAHTGTEEIWGLPGSFQTRTLDTHVMRLRDKLADARAQLETVRGVGYRLIDPANP